MINVYNVPKPPSGVAIKQPLTDLAPAYYHVPSAMPVFGLDTLPAPSAQSIDWQAVAVEQLGPRKMALIAAKLCQDPVTIYPYDRTGIYG